MGAAARVVLSARRPAAYLEHFFQFGFHVTSVSGNVSSLPYSFIMSVTSTAFRDNADTRRQAVLECFNMRSLQAPQNGAAPGAGQLELDALTTITFSYSSYGSRFRQLVRALTQRVLSAVQEDPEENLFAFCFDSVWYTVETEETSTIDGVTDEVCLRLKKREQESVLSVSFESYPQRAVLQMLKCIDADICCEVCNALSRPDSQYDDGPGLCVRCRQVYNIKSPCQVCKCPWGILTAGGVHRDKPSCQ